MRGENGRREGMEIGKEGGEDKKGEKMGEIMKKEG